MNLKNLVLSIHNDEDGATATEYIILLILIACVVIAMVKAFGGRVSERFQAAEVKIEQDVKWE